VVLLSDRLWASRWSRDGAIVGQTIRLADGTCEVVGVLPPAPAFERVPYQAYTPLTFTMATAPRGHFLTVIGRLRPETTVAQASAEMVGLSATINRNDAVKADWRAVVEPWRNTVVRSDSRRLVLVLFGTVVVVLLVASVNVASLALVRASARRRDVSIRLALGAGMARLFSHYLAESLLVVLAGGLLGILVAQWCLAVFLFLAPAGTLPAEAAVSVDGRVLWFTSGLIVLVSLIAGSIPAWQSLRATAADALRGESRSSTASASTRRTQNALLIAQVGLAMVLVTGAAMLSISFARLTRVDPGFDPRGTVTFRLSVPEAGAATEQVALFHAQVLDELQRQPGVASVGASTSLPLHGWLYGTSIRVEGLAATDPLRMNAHVQHVVGDYFDAMGIPLKEGRAFRDSDQRGGAPVAIVNETFARRFIGDDRVIGRQLHLGINDDGGGTPSASWEVVGVIRDVKTGGLADAELLTPEVYVPHGQAPAPTVSYVVRARDPERLLTSKGIRAAVGRVDARVPIGAFVPGDILIDDSVVVQRFRTVLMAAFAGLTLVIAVIGVYAIRAQAVTARLREVGIRLALGATRSQVMRLVIGQGLRLVSAGIALGAGISFAAGGAIQQWLFGVEAGDAIPLLLAAVTLGGAALIASWLPARRATRVHALDSLRHE
jgi:putative ABC transport system permease protein